VLLSPTSSRNVQGATNVERAELTSRNLRGAVNDNVERAELLSQNTERESHSTASFPSEDIRDKNCVIVQNKSEILQELSRIPVFESERTKQATLSLTRKNCAQFFKTWGLVIAQLAKERAVPSSDIRLVDILYSFSSNMKLSTRVNHFPKEEISKLIKPEYFECCAYIPVSSSGLEAKLLYLSPSLQVKF